MLYFERKNTIFVFANAVYNLDIYYLIGIA